MGIAKKNNPQVYEHNGLTPIRQAGWKKLFTVDNFTIY